MARKASAAPKGRRYDPDDDGDSHNFIAGAVKHPGLETAKAKKAGMGVQAYARKHAGDKGKAGSRARFALNMKKIANRRKHGA